MKRPTAQQALFIAALAMLSLRALTPDGYMPGSQGSGLLFELCPAGMPAEVMQILSGGGHHHHHHHGEDDGASVSGTEQCPIGHMLVSAIAADLDTPTEFAADPPLFAAMTTMFVWRQRVVDYRSRAPPA